MVHHIYTLASPRHTHTMLQLCSPQSRLHMVIIISNLQATQGGPTSVFRTSKDQQLDASSTALLVSWHNWGLFEDSVKLLAVLFFWQSSLSRSPPTKKHERSGRAYAERLMPDATVIPLCMHSSRPLTMRSLLCLGCAPIYSTASARNLEKHRVTTINV